MKKLSKKLIAFALVLVMTVTAGAVIPQGMVEVQAASSRVYVNPYSANMVLTYKPGDGYRGYYTTISIMGCDKASQIKNLKSSNKDFKLKPCNGYIHVDFGKKAAKTTISCTVKGVKLKTTLTIKKYSNPCSSFKLGKTDLTSKFGKTDVFKTNKNYKNQKLTIKMKKGWKITKVYVQQKSGSYTTERMNKSSYSKKISLTNNSGYVYVDCYNEKTNVSETLEIRDASWY